VEPKSKEKEAQVADGQNAPTGAQPGSFVDPYRSYNFQLLIPNVGEAHFVECSNVGVKINVAQYREGGLEQGVHQINSRVEYAPIALRYGLTASQDLWNWFMSGVRGVPDRRNASIVLYDSAGTTEVMRWNLIQAWACEWRGAVLNAMAYEVAIETLVVVYSRLERG
jgi:phage tail-like protein